MKASFLKSLKLKKTKKPAELKFLKSLKSEEKLKQVTGTNDQLLAKTMPKADTKIKTQEATINTVGTFSKKKVNLVPVMHKNSLNVAAKVKGK
jgi:ABC-type hemin transport system ATPase subunit